LCDLNTGVNPQYCSALTFSLFVVTGTVMEDSIPNSYPKESSYLHGCLSGRMRIENWGLSIGQILTVTFRRVNKRLAGSDQCSILNSEFLSEGKLVLAWVLVPSDEN